MILEYDKMEDKLNDRSKISADFAIIFVGIPIENQRPLTDKNKSKYNTRKL